MSELKEVFKKDMESAQSLGGRYLKARDLRVGDVLSGFYIGCQMSFIKGKHTKVVGILLMDENGGFERVFTAATTLIHDLGGANLPYMTAIQVTFAGYGGVSGVNEYAIYKPSFLSKTIYDYKDLLPPQLMHLVSAMAVKMPDQSELSAIPADEDGVYIGNDSANTLALEDKSND